MVSQSLLPNEKLLIRYRRIIERINDPPQEMIAFGWS